MFLENEFKKVKTFLSNYFRDKIHFEEDGTQNCLVFQPINRYFEDIDIYCIGYITIKKNWWLWKYLQCESIVSDDWWSRWTYWAQFHWVQKKWEQIFSFWFYSWKQRGIKKVQRNLGQDQKWNWSNNAEYDQDFMKIKFSTDDNLSLNKPLKLRLSTITVGCNFEKVGKFYPQLYL